MPISTDPGLRVLHVVGTSGIGGTERFLIELLREHQSDPSLRSSVCVVDRPAELAEEYRHVAACVEHLDISSTRLGGIRRFQALVRRLQPDVLVLYGSRANLLGRALHRAGGPALVAALRSTAVDEKGSRAVALLDRLTFGRITACVGNSRAALSQLVRRGYPAQKLAYIPPGINLRWHAPGDRAAARGVLNVDPNELVLVCVANLKPVKNHELLLRTSAILRARGLRHRLWLVGEGPERERLQRLCRDLNLTELVTFVGHEQDPRPRLDAADAFALGSLWEGSPSAVIEAMAHGLPVVASAAGDIADLVEDGVSGRVLPAPTPESMADALEQVTVTGSRRQWRDAAAARAARFDARRMASDYAELFRWATRPAPPVPFRVQPPTRISRIISRLNVGGPAIHVVLLTSRMQGAQWRSSLITGTVGHSEGDMSYLAAQHGVTPSLIPELGRAVAPHRDALSFWKLLRLLWIETPDVVHTHASKAGTLGRLAALVCNTLSRRSARCVIVHTYHGHTFTGYFRPSVAFAFRTIERLLARITDAVIVLSEGQRQEIVTVHNIAPPAKTHVVPLGLELDRFLGVDQALRIRARRRFGWEEDRKVVLTPGRLTGVKNHSLLVNAFARAARHDGRLHLVFAGDGELRGEILELVEQLGISSRFELLGWQRDMASLYAAADLVVLPSLNEGTPVVLIESIASGCPVVASRVGGVPDVVDQSCGILVASGDVAELSAAIPRALRLGRLSRDTRQLMLRYSIDRLVLDLSELYSRLLDARRKAGVTARFS